MTDILQLPGWEARATRIQDGEYIIEADYTKPDETCQKCGVIGRLYRHGTKTVSYRDSPIRGKPVVLEGSIQRYKCRDCGETFVQSPAGIETDRRMTTRCVQYIQEQCLRYTFTHMAEHIGCVEGTIRNIASDYVEQLGRQYEPYLPTWLGMDETKLDKQLRCILTDVGSNRPIDILRDREKKTVISWLWHFRDRTNVKGLVIDMWRPYKDAVHTVFPGLPVVIDKFHVVRYANDAMESVRIRTQRDREKGVRVAWKRSRLSLLTRTKNLSEKQRLNVQMWLDNEPALAEAYRLKELLFDIYDMPKDKAIAAYDDFLASIPKTMKADFADLTRAMKNWREEILAYFDHPISNGYTEALNGVAKVINRQGRGYSFEVIRARILYKYQPKAIMTVQEPQAVYRRTTEAHRTLMEALGNRCESCQGVFDGDILEAHNIGPISRGERPRRIYVCPSCHARFHTGLNHDGSQVST